VSGRVLADIRLAIRHLRRAPGYAAAAVVTFALAIGANSAIFSAVNAVLLRPLPMDAPSRVAVVWQSGGIGEDVVELTYRHLREWTSAGQTFTSAGVMASHNWSAVLTGRGDPARIWFNAVSAGFFDTVGVRPILGRGFRPEDDVANARSVAVLSYGTWVRRFGADPGVVGKTMTLDGTPTEIVGVMPQDFDVPRGAEFWVPAAPIVIGSSSPPTAGNLDVFGVFYVVGRLRSGLAMSAVPRELDGIEARLDRDNPGRFKWGERAVVTPILDYVFGPVRGALRMLWVAVGVLLIIACGNVSGLMLTRVARRRHEDAIRLALGAGRGAVARLWLTEIGLISIAGGAIGLLCAGGLVRAIVALVPDDLPRIGEISLNGPVAAFTFAVVVTVALATGLMPLRQAGAVSLVEAFEGERTTSGRQTLRLRSSLLVAQIAMSVVLLVGAGLLVRSFIELRRTDLGFAPDRLVSMTVRPGSTTRPPNLWLKDLLARVSSLPGIESTGAVDLRPLRLGPIGDGVHVYLEGQPLTRQTADANPGLNHQIATPGYFETMRIPLRGGRLFTDDDAAGRPRVAIVGESTARRLWPNQNPVGRRLTMFSFTPGGPRLAERTIVGVVADVRYHDLGQVQLDIYDPALQVGRPADNVVIRTAGEPGAVANAVRAIARESDPQAIVDEVTSMDAVVGRAEAPWRLATWMFVLFGTLAFGLAALGLFSLVALEVAYRRREFAIRVALGSPRGAILRGVLQRAGWRVGGGLTIGFATAFVASRAMRSLLFGIAPDDRATYLAVLALVLIVVTIAAWLPARRALVDDPHSVLREA
jgi:putative ABC transport system permease protein